MINKKILSAACIAALTSGFSTSSLSDTTSGTATANVLQPLTLTAGAGMDFGTVSGDALNPTTVVLTTGGTTTSGDGAYFGGAPAAGGFSVAGGAFLAYNITLPAAATLTHTTIPANTMNVNSFNSLSTTTGAIDDTGALSAGAIDSFTVGATLNMNNGQAAGTYNGTYNVTIAYQ